MALSDICAHKRCGRVAGVGGGHSAEGGAGGTLSGVWGRAGGRLCSFVGRVRRVCLNALCIRMRVCVCECAKHTACSLVCMSTKRLQRWRSAAVSVAANMRLEYIVRPSQFCVFFSALYLFFVSRALACDVHTANCGPHDVSVLLRVCYRRARLFAAQVFVLRQHSATCLGHHRRGAGSAVRYGVYLPDFPPNALD